MVNTKKDRTGSRLSFEYIPLSNIIEEFHFSSPQQFTRFYKDKLGAYYAKKHKAESISTNIAQNEVKLD